MVAKVSIKFNYFEFCWADDKGSNIFYVKQMLKLNGTQNRSTHLFDRSSVIIVPIHKNQNGKLDVVWILRWFSGSYAGLPSFPLKWIANGNPMKILRFLVPTVKLSTYVIHFL